jgi:hypothetical protein
LANGNTSGGNDIQMTTTDEVQFRDTALKISSSVDGQLDIAADVELEIVAPTLDINASTAVTIDTTTMTMTGSVNVVGDLDVDNLNINGNSIISTDTNGNITLDPNGTGVVAVTGPATISGNLTVDTSTLFVDAANNRVGVNTATPTVTLDVGGTIYSSGVIRNTNGGSAATPSIQPGDDADTGMFLAASNTIGFATAGLERTTISSAGILTNKAGAIFNEDGGNSDFRVESDTLTNMLFVDASADAVGIAQSSPSTRLHIAAASNTTTDYPLTINNSANNYGFQVGAYGLSNRTYGASVVNYDFDIGGAAIFKTNNAERLRITSAGLVGIGTSSPAYKLDVVGGVVAAGNGTIVGGISYSTRPEIGAISNHPLGLITNNTTQMLIDTSGNVGIGTSSPAQKVDVQGTGDTVVNIQTNTSGSPILNLSAAGSDSANIRFDRSNNTLRFDISSVANALNLTNAGNVGIGTATPQGDLEIQSKTTGTDAVISLTAAGTRRYQIKALTSVGALAFVDESLATERMRIDSSGNVGVGTSAPSQKLTAVGNVKIAGAQASNVARAILTRTDTSWSINNETDLRFYTGSGDTDTPSTLVAAMTSSGNVGIGTSAPSAPLTVNNQTDNSTVAVFHAGGGTPDRGLKVSTFSSTNNNAGVLLDAQTTIGGAALALGTAGTERMRITSAGSVGIGTSSPSAALDIEGLGNTVAAHIFTSDNVSNATASLVFGTTPGTRSKASIQMVNVNTGNAEGALAFSTNSGASLAERMRVDGAGNLLVGTTSIGGTGSIRGLTIGGGTVANIGASFGSVGALYRYNSVNENGWGWWNERDAGGTVQRFYATSSFTLVGSISVTASATAYNTSSDHRLKEDVQPMVGSVDRLMALKPVNFAWKADGSRVDGFLAHEAQEVVPEAVTGEKDAVDKDGKPEYQGIDQSKLVPLLTAALQEALARIETLEADMAKLKGA